MYSWFTDALLAKNGIVKVWWDDYDEAQREEYTHLDDMEFNLLLSNPDVEVIEHTPYAEDIETYNDVVISRRRSIGRVRIENVPPSEFLISRDAKTIQDARFVCHRVQKTLSELREMYPDKKLDPETLGSGEDDDFDLFGEKAARHEFDNSYHFNISESPTEEALRKYWLHESFLQTDYNGDGIVELRKVCTVGFGVSVADLVMDLQLYKSVLMRNLLDNMYNQNFGRYAVLEGQANLDDLLTQRPGGVVRVKSPNAVMPLATPPLEPYSFQMLEYLDGVRESRAGVSKMSQGMNESALTSHTTATAVNAVMGAAQSRVELIARNFAETGVKDLMLTIYELLMKNQDHQRVVMLRNQWVPVRPDAWSDRMDCTVSVALGNGNKDQQMMHLSRMLQFAGEAMKGGLRIVNEQNMYNLGASLVKAMGFQNVDDFLTNPATIPPQPSPQDQMRQMETQIKQKELEIKAAEVQIKAQKVQQDAQESAVDAQLKMAELQLEREQKRAVAIGAT